MKARRAAPDTFANATPLEWPNVEADGYRSTEGGICRSTKAGGGEEPLTNFPARIVASLVEDDGVEQRRFLEVEAMHRGRPQRFKLSPADFVAMTWPIAQLGPDAILYAGQGKKDRAREAIQLLSGQPVVRHSYAHTGWREIDGWHFYLHAGGAIGAKVNLTTEMALPEALRNYALPEPPGGEALKQAVRASLRMLEVAPLHIVAPLYALIPRAIIGG